MDNYVIRMAEQFDCSAIMSIKNDAIVHSTSVYDEKPEDLAFYEAWLQKKQDDAWPVFVICLADEPEQVCGYASYGPFRNFAAYRFTVENSLYISKDCRGQGLGRRLLQHIMEDARERGFHVMVAAIDSQNSASIHLHEQAGFTYNGMIPASGQKFGQWLDVVFYSIVLDEGLHSAVDNGEDDAGGSAGRQ